MRLARVFLVTGLLAGLSGVGPLSKAVEARAAAMQDAASADAAQPPKPKRHNGLYAFVAWGSGESKDVDSSNETLVRRTTTNTFQLDEVDYGRAAIGWQLPNDGGNFRLVYTGYSESSFTFLAQGFENKIDPLLADSTPVGDNLLWWTATAEPGSWMSVRTPPQWNSSQDANNNNVVDADEVTYIGPDLSLSLGMTDNLQNRVATTDVVFGNTFGGRRFGATWWGGLRYYSYEGTVLAGAWLDFAGTRPGQGWTDGAFLPALLLRQEASGWGPTGALEADFKFWDERFVIYLLGQFAFTMTDLSMDTGDFFSIVEETTSNPNVAHNANAHLTEMRSKSVWNTVGEGGLRLNLKSGVQFELAYNVSGFLDAVLLPLVIRVPENLLEANRGTSATYRTRDLVFKTWRFGVGFQF